MNSAPAPLAQKAFFPHINGLRAVAILGILIYHLRASYCPAGYFGVDAFLVISGFLLIRSLMKQPADRPFHYGSFWLRKAWRILPSWFVLVAVVAVLSCQWMEYERVKTILGTVQSSAYFLADYQIDLSGDYFNNFSQQNPLLHLWYLSLTEQLYLLLPLMIVPLVRWCSARTAAIVLALLALLSLTYWILTNGVLPSPEQKGLLRALGMESAYYHIIPRLWEIAAGGLVLVLPSLESKPALRAGLSLAGLAGFIASFFLYETSSPAVYMAVISTLLVLKYGDAAGCRHILCAKPLQWVGTISFSLYLWHWPVMVFWKYASMDNPGPWDEVGMVLLSFVLGTLAWLLVERLKTPSLPGWRGALLRLSLLLTLPAIFLGAQQLNQNLQNEEHRLKPWLTKRGHYKLSEMNGYDQDEHAQRGFNPKLFLHSNPIRTIGDDETAPPFFFLMGDSHALHLYDGLFEACQKHHVRGLHLNNSINPFWNYDIPHRSTDWNKAIANHLIDYLKAHPEITHVMISLLWDSKLKAKGAPWGTSTLITDKAECQKQTEAGMRELCLQFRAIGKQVVLVGDVHRYSQKRPGPMDEWQRCQRLGLTYKERFISHKEYLKGSEQARTFMQRMADEGLAIYIEPGEVLMREGRFPDRIDGEFTHSDLHHLTRHASRLVSSYILDRLLEIRAQEAAASQEEPAAN